jgi:hypothetical protein
MEKVAGDKFVWEDKQNALNLTTAQREEMALSSLAPAPRGGKEGVAIRGSAVMDLSPLEVTSFFVSETPSLLYTDFGISFEVLSRFCKRYQ